MNFRLLFVALITLQFSACFTGANVLKEKTASEEIAISVDSKNGTNRAEDDPENIRETAQKEPPNPTTFHANDTSAVHSIDGKIAEDATEPDDTDDAFLNGKESILNVLNMDPKEVSESTKKDLSARYYEMAHDTRHLHERGWFWHQKVLSYHREPPLVLKEPSIHSLLTFPLWRKLSRSFARSLIASRKN